MTVKSFDTILTELCDYFDELISPKKITRSNTNIIYLILKATAKGYEVINNVCVTLQNKFDPENCSDEDLISVAKLVGTSKLAGSASGLEIKVTNTGSDIATLLAGEYYYELDEETKFNFQVQSDTVISTNQVVTFIAMSENTGSYAVTEQSGIDVTSDVTIPSSLVFSCSDNANLLGTEDETNLAFRERVLTNTTRQDAITELQTTLRNLPYIFDCKIKFNNTQTTQTVDGINIPPFYMAIFYSGEARNDIASIVAGSSIYPTVETEDAVKLTYASSVFMNQQYNIFIIPYKKKNFSVNLHIKVDTTYASVTDVESSITSALATKFTTNEHTDYIKESDFYNAVSALNLAGVDLLNVDLLVDETAVNYVSIPDSRIPYLEHINFTLVE